MKNAWQQNEVYKILQSHCVASGADKRTLPYFIQALLHCRTREVLDEAIAIFQKFPEDEPMTKNPVILELKVLKQKYEPTPRD